MDIVVINIENDNGRIWNFESKLGAILMLDILSKNIGAVPIHNYFEDEDVIAVILTNSQIDSILGNDVDEEDPVMKLFLRDIQFLKTGKMVFA